MSHDQRIYQSATSIQSLLNTKGASFLMTSHVRSALWTLHSNFDSLLAAMQLVKSGIKCTVHATPPKLFIKLFSFQESGKEALRAYCLIKYTCEPCPIFSYGCSQAVRAINPKRGHLAMPFCNFISHWCTRLNAGGEISAGGKGEPIVWNRSIFFV